MRNVPFMAKNLTNRRNRPQKCNKAKHTQYNVPTPVWVDRLKFLSSRYDPSIAETSSRLQKGFQLQLCVGPKLCFLFKAMVVHWYGTDPNAKTTGGQKGFIAALYFPIKNSNNNMWASSKTTMLTGRRMSFAWSNGKADHRWMRIYRLLYVQNHSESKSLSWAKRENSLWREKISCARKAQKLKRADKTKA